MINFGNNRFNSQKNSFHAIYELNLETKTNPRAASFQWKSTGQALKSKSNCARRFYKSHH